jgi:hypothetical protein
MLLSGCFLLAGCGFLESTEGQEAITEGLEQVAEGASGGPVGLITGGVAAVATIVGGWFAFKKKQEAGDA